ncbi:MAG TPA: response regulator [Dehalococcoidia bacterium]|nr:response regulator [Dehalococcoidia bacterium]
MPAFRPDALTLLLLDDHERARRALARSLSADPQVALAGETDDVREALRLVEAASAHAVLLDIRRADGGGIAALTALASMPAPVRPVVIVHGAFFEPEVWRQANAAGADDWLVKQIDVRLLVARIHAAVRRVLPPERWPRLD